MDSALISNMSEMIERFNHFEISANVFVFNCDAVFAVTTPLQFGRVARIQITRQAVRKELCVTMKSFA